MMNTAFDQRAKQTLSLTPRLQQSVKLLQLSSQEFVQEIQHALANNPFLEEEEVVPGEAAAAEEAEQLGELGLGSASPSEVTMLETQSSEVPDEPFESSYESDDQGGSQDYESDNLEASYSSGSRVGEDGENDFSDWVSHVPTLRQHLHRELSAYRLEARDRTLAELIIDSLDEDGYLREDLEDLASSIDDPETGSSIEASELLVALRLVQNLEPVGVAARDFRECLQLQLRARDGNDVPHALAERIVQDHLALLARRDGPELRKLLGCNADDLQAAHAIIRELNPRPGSRFNMRTADYIVPDVIVRKIKGRWSVVTNPAVMPRARLNQVYADMFHRNRCSDRTPLAQELQEARWLLRNAEQRYSTIQRVAEAIVARQKTFFDYGDVALKPLILREVAEELEIHESTVSRATGNKYMATPRGIFEFKHFFSRQLDTETGGTCSAAAVRALLKGMISAESQDAPLSDVSLTKMLADQGVVVARRTVSKYRGMMKVPPAELRRQV
ncbi:RNA polymerase factor sigma-54 [Uliginosibacterium sp. H3]|uniref:RNA polymerase sigma-54 factor n=1 Tax=Uliginosibacterium silvisoli TaxID=3114758 RepID=A0ABU6K8C7_9RHOO|nr:RNA polymerase factor sigma-54 [Uliginosibacterium sp. H3]